MIRAFAWLLLGLPMLAAAAGRPPDRVLHLTLNGSDNHTYHTLPFRVPPGTRRITVAFDYTARAQKTTIDVGLLGPDGMLGHDGFRGWSGGNKHLFTVSAVDATPSYLPGPITPGRWALLLGVPNIRAGAHAEFTARVWLSDSSSPVHAPAVLRTVIDARPGWYRGDLHMHDAHSDGSCPSKRGHKVPCPLFLTVQAAEARGLDFIAVSDHNTVSQADAMRELQPYFDNLLLLPSREITTFQGHANLLGVTDPLDFRVGSRHVPDWNTLLRAAAKTGGLISVNHPIRPSGERCMGCGWTPQPVADLRRVQAIEVVNGADADTAYSGLAFWQKQLDRGLRLTAVGGSDNHHATERELVAGSSPVGRPSTVVHARSLSLASIMAGIRAGHVFVDVAGSRDRMLGLGASVGDRVAHMGDRLQAAAGATVRVAVRVADVDGGRVQVVVDGRPYVPAAPLALSAADANVSFDWHADGRRHWLRVDVRDAGGHLALVGNPVYIDGGGKDAWPETGLTGM